MQQITEWLNELGLSQYARRFVECDIDMSVLRHLTDQDLKELEVSLGHRRKILAAIAELAGAKPAAPQAVTSEPKPQDSAERRQVTVMFTDLVGSTALSTRLDPEDLRAIIGAYHKCVAATVTRFDGFVAKYMGDGVLVYFGYPRAHEDDAERAVRAGLALISAVASLAAGAPLQVRIGVATGLVVVGDIIGSGEAQERGIVGETPNLAARLQSIAEPNTLVIADGTRRLLGNLFELDDLGRQDLKGIAGPVQAWSALRASSVESRFEALHAASALTPLIGREEEFELLLRRWARAKTGEGQVVLICGEAGIGKSRLTAALLEHLAGEPHTRLRYFCSPQHTDSAFYPIIGQMERAAGMEHSDAPQTRLDKLDAVLARSSTSLADVALFAEMLSLPNDGRYPATDKDPQQRRQRTLEALIFQIESLARQNPVLMIVEDAHWIDPTSLELFSRAANRIAMLPVLLIATFRPEFAPPWVGQPHVSVLNINRLTQREIRTLIDRVIGDRALPASIRQDILERTDGIPLFVEEMTKAVLEAESEGAARLTAATVPSPALAVPASLHASLLARLDRLGPAKEVAQIGAAIGREFADALLTAVVRKPETELRSALDRLVGAGLLLWQGVPPHATYLFKHALVQDAAYGTLLREPRRALHARIAEILESQFAEIAETQPELLARHCAEAGLVEKAMGLWGKAGQRSLERSALVEAAEQFARALALMKELPATSALRREQLKFQVALVGALIHVKGYAAPETKAAADQARLLIEQAETLEEPPEETHLLFSVLYGFWVAAYVWVQGYPEAALRDADEALAAAREIGEDVTLMYALAHAAIPNLLCGHYEVASEETDELIALASEKGSSFWNAVGMMNRGSLFALTGKAAIAVRMLTSGIAAYSATGSTNWIPLRLSHLAAAHAELGEFDDAWRRIGEAMTAMETSKEKLWEAEVHRIAGEIALLQEGPDATKAQASFEYALAVARERQAKSWELRAAMSMARLKRAQGKRNEARDVLAPVYHWFTEGFDTLDLQQAKALLEELHG